MSTDVRTARHGAEDGFHEIQLSGKQLVFLFMATTIVSIVIFLCGVLVGRGARVDAPAEVVDASAPAEQPGQLQPSAGEPVVNATAPPAASAEPGKPTKVDSGDFNYMADADGGAEPRTKSRNRQPSPWPSRPPRRRHPRRLASQLTLRPPSRPRLPRRRRARLRRADTRARGAVRSGACPGSRHGDIRRPHDPGRRREDPR